MSNRLLQGRHVVDLLFTLALFGVFAVSALLVVLLGANVYRGTVRTMDGNFSVQTSLTYVAEKIRQNDVEGGVFIGELAGAPALVLEQRFGGEGYRTMIYAYDGSLRELFTRSDVEVSPEQGSVILETRAFSMEDAGGGLLRFSCTGEDGGTASLSVRLRSEGGAF